MWKICNCSQIVLSVELESMFLHVLWRVGGPPQLGHHPYSASSLSVQDSFLLEAGTPCCILCTRILILSFLHVSREPKPTKQYIKQNLARITNSLTNSLLSTVFTTISSGAYWLTSKRNFRHLSFPSCWIKGEFISSYHVLTSPCLCARSEPLVLCVEDVEDCVVLLKKF